MPDTDLLVIGGGVTGLTAAYLAACGGRRVTVLEGAAEAGGLLGTFPIGGSRLEHYYHHFFSHDVELRWLCTELGLANRLRYLPATMGVFRNGQIFPFNGPRDLLYFSPISLSARTRFAASSLFLGKFAEWRRWEDVPALDWFNRYAGRAATEAIWRPMLEIKFGVYAREVPVAWMVGRLRQRMNSRERGDESLGYLDGSLQTLLDGLLGALGRLGVKLITRAKVESISVRNQRVTSVRTGAGEFSAGQIVATIPTTHLAPLLAPHVPDYAAKLAAIRYFGAVCTLLEMNRPLSDIYWLNVADPGFPFGGVIEHTNFIPPIHYQGRHIAYLSRYFEADHALAALPIDKIGEQMIAPLSRIYPQFRREQIEQIHVFRTLTAATVCDRNFSMKVPAARTPLANFFIASMAHVYPDERSCNNSIRVAAEVCRVMRLETPLVPRGASLSGQISMD